MQKLANDQVLNLPIEIYIFKRQYYLFIGMMVFLTVMFGGFFMLVNQQSTMLIFMIFMITTTCIGIILYMGKLYSSSSSIAKLHQDKLVIYGLSGKKIQSIHWRDIRDLEGYRGDYGNGIMLYLKNRSPFKDTVDVKLYNGAVIEGSLLNTREIENIFQQFIAYHRKSNSEDNFIIRYRNIKRKMSN